MSDRIQNKWLDNYFKERPQLTPPEKSLLGYHIPAEWYEVVHSLLQIVNSHEKRQTI